MITDKVHNNTTLYLEFKEVTEPEYLEQITSGISIDEKGLIHFDRAKLPEKSRQFKKIFIINAYADRYPTVEELDIINVGEMAKYFYSEKIYNCDGSFFDPGIYTGHFNKKDLIVYLLDENNNPLGYYRVNENEAESMNKSVSSAAKEYMNEYRKQKSIPVIDLKGIFHFVYEGDPYKIEIINEIVRMQALDKNISRFAIVDAPADMPDDYFLYKFLSTPNYPIYDFSTVISYGYELGDTIEKQSLAIILLDGNNNIAGYYRPTPDQFRPASEYSKTFVVEPDGDFIFDSNEEAFDFVIKNFSEIRKVDGKIDTRYTLKSGLGIEFGWSQKVKTAVEPGKVRIGRIKKRMFIFDDGITYEIISNNQDIKYKFYTE
ncbi:hypothetical protein ODU73_000464 [Thermoclostridium stercorarium]|uniref:hypothetical protein n=1 Tax=Thermoclostridium stercorarium TaxID=1510 RepID=UPI002248FDAC|nr:hypothetical protein [Thermoclostridium stercorarium]UZQ86065.1 hypothetical protein ODU73_000464 [Thermoclostridium stercorarium]